MHVSASAELLITAQTVKQRLIPPQEFAMILHAHRAHSHRRCRRRPLPGRPHHRNLIAAAVDQARREHRAAHGDRCAELDTITAALARTQQATDRYLLAYERSTLDEDLIAERLAALKTTRQQLTTHRDASTTCPPRPTRHCSTKSPTTSRRSLAPAPPTSARHSSERSSTE